MSKTILYQVLYECQIGAYEIEQLTRDEALELLNSNSALMRITVRRTTRTGSTRNWEVKATRNRATLVTEWECWKVGSMTLHTYGSAEEALEAAEKAVTR